MRVKATGCLDLVLREYAGGPIITEQRGLNLLVNTGRAGLAALLAGVSAVPYLYVALGTDATAAAAGQTALIAEIVTAGGERTLGIGDRTTVSTTDDTARVIATFTFTGSFAINEAGLFNDAAAGTMLARRVPATINVVNGNILEVTWTVQFS